MAIPSSVVAHYVDGRIQKGFTRDFFPHRPSFHITPMSKDGPIVHVRCSELKAVFFVRDLDGDPLRSDLRGFVAGPAETVHGRKIAVRFQDGELLCGYSLAYAPQRHGFFMFPADPGSNNQRVFVITASSAEILEGQAADEMVQKILNSEAA